MTTLEDVFLKITSDAERHSDPNDTPVAVDEEQNIFERLWKKLQQKFHPVDWEKLTGTEDDDDEDVDPHTVLEDGTTHVKNLDKRLEESFKNFQLPVEGILSAIIFRDHLFF